MNPTKPIRQMATRRASAPSAFSQSLTIWLPAVETVVGITLVVAIGVIMPDAAWGLLNVNPHPLWIIAAAIAARHGGRAGYFAGALTGLTYCALIVARVEGTLAPLDPQTFVQPLLMFVTGAALGELTDAREKRLAGLETRARDLKTALEKLWERHRAVNMVNETLNRRIAFGSGTDDGATLSQPRGSLRRMLESAPPPSWAGLPDSAERR